MRRMRGVQLVDLDRHTDARGSLVAFGSESPIPFDVKNVYFILDCPPDAIRGGHANTNHSAIIAVNSAVTIDLDNGSERGSQRLTRPDTALIVKAGVWMRVREFDEQTVLVFLSSEPFEKRRHFEGPVPELQDGGE
jgi:hypothetical protein